MLRIRPRRWLAHLALAFGAGIYLGYRLPPLPVWWAALGLSALWLMLLRRQGRAVYPACMALAVLLGLARCSLAAHPALPPEGACRVTAAVTGEAIVRETDGRVAVYLKDVRLSGHPGTYRAYWTYWPREADAPVPLDGQRVTFAGRLYHPSGQVNPHGFNFRLYLLQKGVTLGLTGCEEMTLEPLGQTAPRSILLRLRRGIRARLDALMPQHSPLAAALLLNDKSDLPEDTARSFRLAGVAHVLAVSGLHVMILFSCVTLLLRRFSPSQRTVLAVGGVLLGFYSLLVGAQAAVLRAGVLMVFLQAGRIARRRLDRLTALAAAFALLLMLRPLDLFQAGFQMSFSAVLAMIMLGDRLRQLARRLPAAWMRKLLQTYGVTVCAAVGAALPISWYYHRVSVIGLLINPVIGLAVTLLLPLGMLALSAVWFPAAAGLGKALSLFCAGMVGLVERSAALPFSSVAVPRLPVYALAAGAAVLLLLTRYVLLSVRRRALLGICLVALAGAGMALTANRDVCYIQFSEGSADAAVIEDGRKTIVIDAAENGTDLAEYLLSEGRGADWVILTHLHADHVLGLQALLEQQVPIGAVYLSTEAFATPVAESCRAVLQAVQDAGIPIRTICAGDQLRTERVAIDVLWPQRGGANALADANDFALALEIRLDGVSLLQMSDVSGAYELYAARPARVIKAAHHGSASSTGERFLAAVQPAAALISTRKASDQTLQRLAEAGVMVYDTNEHGALTLWVHRGEAYIRGYVR